MPTVSLPLSISSVGLADNWNVVGTTNKVTAVTDVSDSTYITPRNSDPQHFNFAPLDIAPILSELNGSISSVVVTLRAAGGPLEGGTLNVHLVNGALSTLRTASFSRYGGPSYPYTPPTPWASTTLTFTTGPGGGAWTFAQLADLYLSLSHSGSVQIAKIGIQVNATIDSYLNAPTDLAVDSSTYSSVSLSWTDNSEVETGYEIQRSTNNVDFTTVLTRPADSTTFVDSVRSQITYYYRVRAIYNSLASAWSSTVSVTTPAPSGPPTVPPTDVIAPGKTPTTIPLTWFVVDDLADSYVVQRSVDGTTWIETVTVFAPTQTHTFTVLPGSTYYFRVKSVNSLGESAYTSAVQITTPEFSFRKFLQDEVLQGTAYYLRWFDRVNTNPDLFTVTQSIPFTSDIEVPDLANLQQRGVHPVFFYRSEGGDILIDKLLPLIRATGGLDISMNFDPVVIATRGFGDLIGIANIPPYTTKVKLDSPLTMDVPKNTIFWTSPDDTLRFLVGNNDIINAKFPFQEEYFDEAVTFGAKVGETLIEVNYQEKSGGVWGAIKEGYPMGVQAVSFTHTPGVPITWQIGTVKSGVFQVTQSVDHTVEPFDASPIYDSITTEALLRIGYLNEADVPASKYQQFRDAGRVEVWRAVTYATLHYQDALIEGTWKRLSEVHAYASNQLTLAEAEYLMRYTVPVVSTPVEKPRATSYSRPVKVKF